MRRTLRYERRLLSVADRMYGLSDEARELQDEGQVLEAQRVVQRAVSLACRSLGEVLETDVSDVASDINRTDPAHYFGFDLARAHHLGNVPEARIVATLRDTEGLEYFLEIQERILVSAGASGRTTRELIIACREALLHGADDPAPLGYAGSTVDWLRQGLERMERLRQYTCDTAAIVLEDLQERERTRLLHRTVRRVATGLGGVAIIGLAGTALGSPMPLSALGIVVSGVIGSQLIERAIPGDEPRQRGR